MRAVLLILALGLSACAGGAPSAPSEERAVDAGGLTLAADAGPYARGAQVRLVLRNAGGDTYEGGVLSCAVTERWDGGAWVEVQDSRACIAMAVRAAPGETLEGEVPLDVAPGTYRLRHRMTGSDGEAMTVATAPFRVAG